MKTIFRLKVTEEEKRNLKIEFDRLETIEEKYFFWKERFGFSYFFWANVEYVEFQDFIINPITRTEKEKLNKLIYEEDKLFPTVNGFPKLKVWRREFEKNYEISPDKENVISYELKRIDDFVASKKSKKDMMQRLGIDSNPFLVSGFEKYFLRGEEFDWGEREYEPMNLLAVLRGIELAKYRVFVSGYSKKSKKGDSFKLTGEQKVLVLHYLGFCENIDNGSQKGKIYEYFLDGFKHKSILKIFSGLSDYENEKNLDVLIDFFRHINQKPIARILEDKLENLNKNRLKK